MAVWDPLVRAAHWALVGAIAVAWFTSEFKGETANRVHEWAGYAALGVIGVRLAWGFAGSRRARFASFIRSPAQTLVYARAVVAGREARHIGHNPLGGWMVAALLLMATLAAGSGWLYVTDRYFGEEWLEDLHEGLANALFALIGLHVAGVAFTSWRQRENLVGAMLTGRKRAAQPGDVD
jgi:cytochrome b